MGFSWDFHSSFPEKQKYGFPQIPHLLLPEEQNKLILQWNWVFLFALNTIWVYSPKIFQSPLHPRSFSKCINSFTIHFWLLLFFAFNINKIKKKINPQNPMDPRRKKFHSLKPCQTKEIHSSYSSFPAEWNLVRNCKPYWLEILYAKDLIFWSLNVVMILEHQN